MANIEGPTMQIAHVPQDTLIYAVGDIHGQDHLLDDLLRQIVSDAEGFTATRRLLIFLGDYVDRGPASADVIERLITGVPESFESHALLGNHEVILLKFLERPETLLHWLSNGGEETLAAYGVRAPDDIASHHAVTVCRDSFAAALPRSHLSFLKTLDFHFSCGDYFFVHAGVRPGIPLEEQDSNDLIWIRHDFLGSREDFGAVVVHGHTPAREPVIRANRICIDTGAFLNGRLTAIRLYEGERSFLTARQ
jgi:serine/threonine protein phosphatase 1